jgi:hypothetical protein
VDPITASRASPTRASFAQDPPTRGPTRDRTRDIGPTVEEEVLSNVERQEIDGHTLADLHLPPEFLVRVADRIIRASYEERYRLVVQDRAARDDAEIDGARPAPAASSWPLAAGLAVLFLIAAVLFVRRSR